MAKGNVMLQLEVSQIFASAVTFVPHIDALVFDTLDGDLTRIREIAIQKVGHHSGTPNVKAFQTSSESATGASFPGIGSRSTPARGFLRAISR